MRAAAPLNWTRSGEARPVLSWEPGIEAPVHRVSIVPSARLLWGLLWPSASVRLPGARRPSASARLPGARRPWASAPLLWGVL